MLRGEKLLGFYLKRLLLDLSIFINCHCHGGKKQEKNKLSLSCNPMSKSHAFCNCSSPIRNYCTKAVGYSSLATKTEKTCAEERSSTSEQQKFAVPERDLQRARRFQRSIHLRKE